VSNGPSFDSTKEFLHKILDEIKSGKTQLPDFQRGWVWDDDHVKSLLASISMSYPIGAVMLYETGNPDVRFKPRPAEGVTLKNAVKPEWLILDGQQRLTSLFQALCASGPAKTRDSRGNAIERWYYVDIRKALDPEGDRDEAIVSVPGEKIAKNFRGEVLSDLSTTDKECHAGMFPLSLVFDTAGLTDWQMKFVQEDQERIQERLATWNALVQQVILRFQQYQVPLIKMFKATPKEAVCQVFEKVNTGGVSLTVFELLTATYAADDFNLREDWAARDKKLRQNKVLATLQSDDFLQAVSLIASRLRRMKALQDGAESQKAPAITCKRKDLLRLSLGDYRKWADDVEGGFQKAARFMHVQRIFTARDLPYRTQLAPLAAIFTVLGDQADHDSVRAKLTRWFWCGVFGELYGGTIESRFAKDLPQVLAWVGGGPEPDTIADANFASSRLYTLRTRNSAAYKGLYALLIKDGGLDFRTGEEISVQMYFDDKIDIHHIFPQTYCLAKGIDAKRCDCIVNKTAVSAKTNRIIGGNAPSEYLRRLERQAGIENDRMESILASHVIESEALETDDFDTFFAKREAALLNRIEKAMGKPVQREVLVTEAAPEIVDFEDEDESETDGGNFGIGATNELG
jgi:hypothetical protein